MGYSKDELFDFTLKEFVWVSKGYREKVERENIERWAVARWQTTHLLNISGKALKRDLKYDDLMQLGCDIKENEVVDKKAIIKAVNEWDDHKWTVTGEVNISDLH